MGKNHTIWRLENPSGQNYYAHMHIYTPTIQPLPKRYTNSEVLITIETEEIELGHLQELRINYKRIHFRKRKVVCINIEQRGMSEAFAYQFLSFLFLFTVEV